MKKRWMLLMVACSVAGALVVGLAFAHPWATSVSLVSSRDAVVATTEDARAVSGSQVRTVSLSAGPVTVTVGGRQVATWAFNGQVPGPQIQATAGDTIRAEVTNNLPQPLTVHWHGIAIRNDMDGVPHQTQEPIPTGGTFTYEFTAAHEGSYFYHSHVGVQMDRGLYGALIVAPREPDTTGDVVMLLDDWTDGVGQSPDELLSQLQPSTGSGQMGGMNHGTGSGMAAMDGMNHGATDPANPLGNDTVDIEYPMYLINGKDSGDPSVVDVEPGESVRVRLINAAASTPFRVASGGGPMTVIATDGYAVVPVFADSLVVGMGERYDVLVTAPETGTLPVVAQVEGKSAQVMSVLRVGGASLPKAPPSVAGLGKTPLSLPQLRVTEAGDLKSRPADVDYTVTLNGGMMGSDWSLDVSAIDGVTIPIRQGQRVRLTFTNNTMMWHPMHLHGHTYQVITASGDGPRKDTVAVAPMSKVTVEFDADNPGQWMLHCHNIYHAEVGMMTTLSYVK